MIMALPSEPSHIIIYVDTDDMAFFIHWIVDKMRKDEECEGYEESDITDIVVGIATEPHKYNREFQEYKQQKESQDE